MTNVSHNSTPVDEPSDQSLMAQLAAGNQEAIVPLLVRYAPRVLGLAATAVDRAAAEEVVQEVFVAVWRSVASFDPAQGTFRNWLLQITRNRIANELRRRGRRPDTRPVGDEIAWTTAADPNPEPPEMVWHDFRRKALHDAVDALPQKQKQALSLAFFDELTHQQIAAVLDVPLGTAKTRVRSALAMLRERLTPRAASFLSIFLLLAGLTGLFLYQRNQSSQLDRQQRALALVTSSDVVLLRLEPLGGVNPKTHGTYRGRPGTALAVFTFSNFAAAPSGQEYRIWVRVENRWLSLGVVPLDSTSSGRLIVENPALAKPPQELRVTLESTSAPAQPAPSTAATVIVWPARE